MERLCDQHMQLLRIRSAGEVEDERVEGMTMNGQRREGYSREVALLVGSCFKGSICLTKVNLTLP